MATIEENWAGGTQGQACFGANLDGQSFTIGTTGVNKFWTLTSVEFYAKRNGANPGTGTIEIYAASDSGLPTGSVLSSGTFNINALSSSYSTVSIGVSSLRLEPDTQYCIVIKVPDGNIDNRFDIRVTSPAPPPYTGGTYIRTVAGVWESRSDSDTWFRAIGTVVACSALTTQADCETASCYWYDSACHTNPYFEGTRDVYASGFTARFQKRQIIGYFPVSGDLRSIWDFRSACLC